MARFNQNCWRMRACRAGATIGLMVTPACQVIAGETLTADAVPTIPTTVRATYESWRLSDNERMGIAGATLFVDVHPAFKLGVGTYGAIVGQRGGFITLGLAGEAQTYLAPGWRIHSGLFLGAGGGRDASQQVGGGFMFRADAGITYETGRYGNFGVGVSYVTFPTGDIRSTQPYLLYEYPFDTLLVSGWDTLPVAAQRTSGAFAPANRQEFSLVSLDYQIPTAVTRSDGSPQSSSMQLLGAQWTKYLDTNWFVTFESEGALGGSNSGYMQILAGGGYRVPLGASTSLKLWASAGAGGGGGVDTGGGFLVAGGVSLAQMLSKRDSLELSVGAIDAPQASFRALLFGLKFSHQFDAPEVSAEPVSIATLGRYDQQHLRMRAVNQTYLKASQDWRSRDTDMAVNNLGVQVDYFISRNAYLTGQGLAAYSGNAGAYMAGLVGAGAHLDLGERWFLEAEALIGAAGGGSFNVGSGLVGQYNIGIGYQVTPALSISLTGGQIASSSGGFRANVVGASVGYRFTGFTE